MLWLVKTKHFYPLLLCLQVREAWRCVAPGIAWRSWPSALERQRCRTDDLRVWTDQNDGNPMRLSGTGNHWDLMHVGMIYFRRSLSFWLRVFYFSSVASEFMEDRSDASLRILHRLPFPLGA